MVLSYSLPKLKRTKDTQVGTETTLQLLKYLTMKTDLHLHTWPFLQNTHLPDAVVYICFLSSPIKKLVIVHLLITEDNTVIGKRQSQDRTDSILNQGSFILEETRKNVFKS